MFTREAPNRLWVTDITEYRTSCRQLISFQLPLSAP
jgi:hypothetical protein